MDNLSWAEIFHTLQDVVAELRKVERTWIADANVVASVALSVDKNRLRHLRDPERLNELRRALSIIEGFLGDMADADEPPS